MSDEQAMSAQTESWPRPHRLTVHDYYRMAEVGLLSPGDRTELIEGEIIDMPPIGSVHASVVTLLTRRLLRAVDDSVEVRVQLPVRFMPRSEAQPDLVLVKHRADAYRPDTRRPKTSCC
jgi:Uma2 family endonuclease